MVNLTELSQAEIEAEGKTAILKKAVGDEEDDADYETDSDIDDDLKNETISDRLFALLDIIPPTTRSTISHLAYTTSSYSWWTASIAGKVAWVVATSAAMLLLPVILEVEKEQAALAQQNGGVPGGLTQQDLSSAAQQVG
ncbi:mitochondrial import receptor protein [Gonapodya sp. JEL0774]|nr:mitochondrial import receptor protein [Gonapodya sp. JEL0774]